MIEGLNTALGALAQERPDGLILVPTSTRALGEALQILASKSAALHRDAGLSLNGLNHLGKVEPKSGTAAVGAGIKLAALESALQAQSLSLGPLSPRALQLTLAEFLEGPDAGLRAIPGGRLEPLCLAITAVLPDGRVHFSHPSPRSAAGPDLVALMLGGAGRLGVITEAVVRCFPKPTARKSHVFSFPSAEAFVTAVLAVLSDGAWLESIRVETRSERAQVELNFLGTPESVERDFGSLGHRAFDVGGRPSGRLSGEFPIAVEGAAPTREQEVTWDAVREAVAAHQPLELHRMSIASVIARGEVTGMRLDQGGSWPDVTAALALAIDPRGVLGGAP